MDTDKGKQPIEDVVVNWTSSDSDKSSSNEEEWASTIRRSRAEYESLQSRKGAETSNEAPERSRPVTTSGERVLSIPLIA